MSPNMSSDVLVCWKTLSVSMEAFTQETQLGLIYKQIPKNLLFSGDLLYHCERTAMVRKPRHF